MVVSFTFGYYDPPFPMDTSDDQKMAANCASMASHEISAATLNHEIVRVKIDWSGAARPSAQESAAWPDADDMAVQTRPTRPIYRPRLLTTK